VGRQKEVLAGAAKCARRATCAAVTVRRAQQVGSVRASSVEREARPDRDPGVRVCATVTVACEGVGRCRSMAAPPG